MKKKTIRKVVYNACFGGFSLSREAILLGRKLSGDPNWGGACIIGDTYDDGTKVNDDYGGGRDISRHDPILVEVVEQLGEKASGSCANLQIADHEGPYRIDEYDGNESVVGPGGYEWL